MTLSVTVPLVRELAGIVKVKAPTEFRVCTDEVKPPPDSVTVPVGMALVPLTVVVTVRLWFMSNIVDDGITATFGVSGIVTVMVVELVTAL